MRIAPSRRITSPLSIWFSTMCDGERGVLVRPAEPGRERDRWRRARLRVLGQARRASACRRCRARSCMTRMPRGREVARDRQRHADDAALRGRVGGLADLAVEGGDRGGVDDHAALAVARARSSPSRRPRARITLNVPIRLTSIDLPEQLERVRRAVPPSVRSAQPTPAQLTHTRRSPPAAAWAIAASTCASWVTSHSTNVAALGVDLGPAAPREVDDEDLRPALRERARRSRRRGPMRRP